MHYQPGERTGALCCGFKRGDRLADEWDLVTCVECTEIAVNAAGAFSFNGHNRACQYKEAIEHFTRELGGAILGDAPPDAVVAALREAVENRVVKVFLDAKNDVVMEPK